MQDKLCSSKNSSIFAAKLEILILFILNGHCVVKRGVRFFTQLFQMNCRGMIMIFAKLF